jgi:hypothetical protein
VRRRDSESRLVIRASIIKVKNNNREKIINCQWYLIFVKRFSNIQFQRKKIWSSEEGIKRLQTLAGSYDGNVIFVTVHVPRGILHEFLHERVKVESHPF